MNRLAAAMTRVFTRIAFITLCHAVPLLLALALCAAGNAAAKEYAAAPPLKNAPPLAQRFPNIDRSKYKASAWSGKIARDIADKKHNYRTRARWALDAARKNADSVNFAGRYIVFSFGCGTSCLGFNVIDAASGRIFDGFEVYGYYSEDGRVVDLDLSFDKRSTLLYVQGKMDEWTGAVSGTGSFAFAFKDGAFSLLQHSPVVGVDEWGEEQ